MLKPLYRRQHSSSSAEVELRPALRVSFRLLKQLVPALKPRFLPSISRSVQMRIGRIYADAFITMHGERRCSGRWLEASSALQQLKQSTNGWGAIYFSPSGARSCFRAQVPVEVLQQCCSSTDYIYWLEAVAQLISIAVVARDQFDCLICFVDNTAVEHALNRGTSKNPALCWLLRRLSGACSLVFSVLPVRPTCPIRCPEETTRRPRSKEHGLIFSGYSTPRQS